MQEINPFEPVELRMLQRGLVTTNEGDSLRLTLGIAVSVMAACLVAYYDVNIYFGLPIPFTVMALLVSWMGYVDKKIAQDRIIEIESRCSKTN